MTDRAPLVSTSSPVFREAMAPTVSILHELESAVAESSREHHYQPTADSRAMRELAAEAETYGQMSDWDGPIRDTHSLGGITLLAAADYCRSFAVLFEGDRAPTFGHLVIARAALEASVIAGWLNEPAVEVPERIKRGLCELMYSAMESRRLKIDPQDEADRQRYWRSVIDSFGWTFAQSNRNPVVDGVSRPSIPDGINDLLTGDRTLDVGRVQWSYLSSVGHVTWYGLRQSIDAPVDSPLGRPVAAVGTTSRSAYAQALCVLRALRVAATKRLVFMGWADDAWLELCSRVTKHEAVLIQSSQPSA